MNKRLIAVNAFIVLFVFFALEVLSGYGLNAKRYKRSSLLYAVIKISESIKNPSGYSEKYKRVLALRKRGKKDVFPAYVFDPQVHASDSLHWLGYPPSSLVVYCNEGSGLTEFRTNKLGFRSVPSQNLDKPIDSILIGDSYADGACINSPSDIASILGKESNLLNLGMGGSGPLFQLGLIKEFFKLVDSGEILLSDNFNVIWMIFTGNDLANLAEEKQTKLSLYLNDNRYSQDYFHSLIHDKGLISGMRLFYDSVVASPNPNSKSHGYGETVTPGSISEQNALIDFARIVHQFNELVKEKRGNLSIVVLANHPGYNNPLIMKSTQKMLDSECSRLHIDCMKYNLSDPDKKKSARGHLDELEYSRLAAEISKFLASRKSQ